MDELDNSIRDTSKHMDIFRQVYQIHDMKDVATILKTEMVMRMKQSRKESNLDQMPVFDVSLHHFLSI